MKGRQLYMLQKLQEKAVIDWNNYLTKQEVQKFLSKDDKTESAEEIIYSKEFKPRYKDLHNDLQKKYDNSWNKKELIQDLVQFYNFGNLVTEEKDYVHGYCQEWVELNKKPEDKFVVLTEKDYEIEKLCLLHTCLLRNNKYIDANGQFSSIKDMLDEGDFDYGDYDVVVYTDFKDYKKFIQDLLKGYPLMENKVQEVPNTTVEKDTELILYHNTTNENAIKINKEGIIPGLRVNAYGKGSEAEGNGIWCSTVRGYGYGGATITFKVNANDPYLYKANDTEYVVYRKIEPQEIIDIDLMISDIPCNYKRTDTINSTVESDIPSAIKDWGKDKLLQVFSNNSKHFAQPYNTEQLKTLIETGNKYCKGTIQMESKLNESKFILKGTMDGNTFDVASSDNKQGLEKFKQEMTPGNPNVTFWIEDNSNKVTEGMHLYGFVKDMDGNSKVLEYTDYSDKKSFEDDLRGNGYTVRRINDNRDMYIMDHSDFLSINHIKSEIAKLKQDYKYNKEHGYETLNASIESKIKDLQRLIDEANKIPLDECYSKLQEKSRNELLAKTKMQTKTRYEKSDNYRGFGFKGVDTSNLLTDNTLPVVCRVGDYEDTVELQDVLYWIQEQAKRNSNNKVDNHTVRDAILQAIDAMDIKVDCTCPDFAYRMAYQASEGGYKYGKQETRPANITNPMNYGALCKHLTAMLSNKKWLQKVAAPVMNWMDEHIEDVNKFLRVRPGEELVLPNETARTLGKAGALSKQQNRKQRLLDILKDFIRNRRNFILRNVNDDRELREGIKAYIKHEYTSEDGKIDYLKVDETELDFLLDELNKWLVSKGYKQIQKDEPEQEENNTQEETNPEESEE